MDILDMYKKVAVRLECKNIKGSGCIFQPDSEEYTYIITAKHCLKGYGENIQDYENKDVKVYSESIPEEFFRVKDVFEHQELDIALIVIDYINIKLNTYISNLSNVSNIGIYGYPRIFERQESGLKSHKLKCELNNKNDTYIEVITPHTHSYTNEAASNIRGLSGSGIFLEYNNSIFLTGIFTELKDSYGTFNALIGIKISVVEQLIKTNGLAELIPKELSNFKNYINTTFEVLEGSTRAVLTFEAKKIIQGSPKKITETLNKKLFLPYKSDYELAIYENKIWEGWLAFLTYIYMNCENIEAEKFLEDFYSNCDTNQLRMFYSEESSLPGSIMALCDIDIYDEMKSGDVIIINSPKTPPLREIGHEKFKTKVLNSIDSDLLYAEKGHDITNPQYYKEMKCIHIDLFLDKFVESFEISEKQKVREIIISGIKEVLN